MAGHGHSFIAPCDRGFAFREITDTEMRDASRISTHNPNPTRMHPIANMTLTPDGITYGTVPDATTPNPSAPPSAPQPHDPPSTAKPKNGPKAPKAQGQRLDGDNLQEVLDSAANAGEKGRQQFFTPIELGEILTIPLPSEYTRIAAVDLTSGDGNLLRALKPRTALGCEIDTRLARKPTGAAGEWELVAGDVTRLYALLDEVDFRADCFGLNPPFSLKWETARLAGLAESRCAAVQEVYGNTEKSGEATVDSTLATLMIALDLCTERGEGFMICNQSTAARLFGDPELDIDEAEGPGVALRQHIWLWLTLPPGIFENTRDLTTAVLYFAPGHFGEQPFRMVSPSADLQSIRYLLNPMRTQRSMLRRGGALWSESDANHSAVGRWNAARHEYNARYRSDTARAHNIWLEKGRIKRHLTPFQNHSGKIPRDLILCLNEIDGRTPMELVVNRDTRLSLQRAVRSTFWVVDPALVTLVDECVATYHSNRAPFYPLSPLMRLGFLDENDQIQCQRTADGFTAGNFYPILCSSEATERADQIVNIFGEEQDVTLMGQELVVRIQDDTDAWVAFTDRPDHTEAVKGLRTFPLAGIIERFVVPDVPDVARAHPEIFAANMKRLDHIEAPLKRKSREYQKQDICRLAVHDGGLLGWDPGLGKTRGMYLYPQVKGARRVLLVAPDSLHDQIVEEGKKHFGISVKRLNSQEDFFADPFLQNAWRDVVNCRDPEPGAEQKSAEGWYITGYTALGYNGADEWLGKERNVDGEKAVVISDKLQRTRQKWPHYDPALDEGVGEESHGIRCVFTPTLATLVAHVFDCVECDEGVRVKSNDSCMSIGVRRLRPRFRAIMSGTPIKNRLDDIFWLAHWVAGGNEDAVARWPYPNSNKAKEEFADQHMIIERNLTREERAAEKGARRRFEKRTPQLCNVHRLWKLLCNVVIRRRKSDIGEDIVPKTIIPIRVPAGTAQQAVYKFHVENAPEFTKSGKEMNDVAAIVTQLQNLRQAAICPDSPNLSWEYLSLFRLREILREESGRAEQGSAEGCDENATRRAVGVAIKAERTPFAGEAKVALEIVEKMLKGNARIDVQAVITAAPTLRLRLEAAAEPPGEPGSDHPKNARSWTDHNPKQATCLKLIEELISKGEQVVVMSPFQHFSQSLFRRLNEAGVSVCLLDGNTSPRRRGEIAGEFKRGLYSVLIGGILSMGEGHSFECAAHLIIPSLDWAFDKNRQAEDRVHRLTSTKPVTIYALATNNTVDIRLQSLYSEKSDSSCLALDGAIAEENTEEINIGQLLRDAIRNFDINAETIDELDIEQEWERTLRGRLRLAEKAFRQWHPPIVTDSEGYRPSAAKVRAAVKSAGLSAMVTIVKAVPEATFGALIQSRDPRAIAQVKADFIAFCEQGLHTDWRRAWKAFDDSRQPAERRIAALIQKSNLQRLSEI